MVFHTFRTGLKAATDLWKVRAGQHALFVCIFKFTVTLLSHISNSPTFLADIC